MPDGYFRIACKDCLRYAGSYFLLILFVSGCAATPMSDKLLNRPRQDLAKPVELVAVPFFPQDQYQCGPAALAAMLNTAGVSVAPADLTPKIYIPEKRGSLQVEIQAAIRRYGRLPYPVEPELEAILMQVVSGKPVLVLQNLGLSWIPQWHYAVVIGFDLKKKKLILRSGTIKRYLVDIRTFEHTWRRAGRWAYVVLRPGEVPEGARDMKYFRAVADSESGLDFQSLKAAYEAGIRRWPGNRLLVMGLGNLYYRAGQYQQAGHWYTNVIAGYPDYAPAHNNLAQVLMEQGEYQEALYHVEKAIALGGSHREIYENTRDEIISRRDHAKSM